MSVFYTDKGRNVGMCYQDMMGEDFLLMSVYVIKLVGCYVSDK